jgi:hypothetical protein
MLFTCRPPAACIPGSFHGQAHAHGRWFTVDIHCHARTAKAIELVARNGAGLLGIQIPAHL